MQCETIFGFSSTSFSIVLSLGRKINLLIDLER